MKTTLAVIFANRDFFPDHLITEGRRDIEKLFSEMGIHWIALREDETKLGSVESYRHAKICAELFKQHRDEIDGILVCLPNFGDERSIADTVKLSGLNVPILVQAYPDDLSALNIERRRDAFCGKISACSNLRQYGFNFTLTERHTVHPLSESFRRDLQKFVGVCHAVKGLRSARLGAIGARPAAFNTVRFSEKLLQGSGISVTTVDLSEILGEVTRLKENDPHVRTRLEEIGAYARHDGVPSESMLRMARLGVVINNWMEANELNATALQCWTSVQKNYGVNVCTLMSMMSDKLMPSACETDITGVASMYALQLASGFPGALVDWNNNYADDPDRCVFWHCGNWAKSFIPETEIASADILGTEMHKEETYGAMRGSAEAGPMTFARISTDDAFGLMRAYTGEGEITGDPLDTFGHRAVVHVPGLQGLLKYICNNGFEHHVAMTMGCVAGSLSEAFENYLGWDVYHHES